ncbi:MAG TPA: SDR family oxidoreductase [Vicinamibacterales bacterium]|nr:SDR family oxidoreductase [Vicinamibacterales bacterium]
MGHPLSRDVAIITGAGRGIGRSIALSLAAEGAAVAVCARTEAEIAETAALVSASGGRALSLKLDVTDPAAVRDVVKETTRTLGPVTLLVNNAGAPGPAGLDWEVEANAWFECLDVIVKGAFLLCHAVVPGMIARGSGRIINVASVSGTRPVPPIVATSVAKTALIRFSETLARELDGHGVRVFSIHPGIVRTRLVDSYGLSMPDEWFVGPERAGTLCAGLASGRYDALSGCFLDINDSLDALVSQADEIKARELYTLRIQSLDPSSQQALRRQAADLRHSRS